MVGSLPAVCARAASGHATAEPPTNEMKSRRRMALKSKGQTYQYRRGAETALCNTAKSGGRGPFWVKSPHYRTAALLSAFAPRSRPQQHGLNATLCAKTGLVQCSKIALIFSRVLCEGRLNKYHLLPKPARPSMKAEFASRLAAPGKRFQ